MLILLIDIIIIISHLLINFYPIGPWPKQLSEFVLLLYEKNALINVKIIGIAVLLPLIAIAVIPITTFDKDKLQVPQLLNLKFIYRALVSPIVLIIIATPFIIHKARLTISTKMDVCLLAYIVIFITFFGGHFFSIAGIKLQLSLLIGKLIKRKIPYSPNISRYYTQFSSKLSIQQKCFDQVQNIFLIQENKLSTNLNSTDEPNLKKKQDIKEESDYSDLDENTLKISVINDSVFPIVDRWQLLKIGLCDESDEKIWIKYGELKAKVLHFSQFGISQIRTKDNIEINTNWWLLRHFAEKQTIEATSELLKDKTGSVKFAKQKIGNLNSLLKEVFKNSESPIKAFGGKDDGKKDYTWKSSIGIYTPPFSVNSRDAMEYSLSMSRQMDNRKYKDDTIFNNETFEDEEITDELLNRLMKLKELADKPSNESQYFQNLKELEIQYQKDEQATSLINSFKVKIALKK